MFEMRPYSPLTNVYSHIILCLRLKPWSKTH